MPKKEKKTGSEQRKYPRVITQLEVVYQKYFLGGIVAEPYKTITRNVSHCGVYFETGEALHVGDLLKVELQIPKITREIILIGKVVRVIQVKEHEKYGIGVNFEKIEDEYVLMILQKLELFNVEKILQIAGEKGATDVHLVNDQPPIIRVGGSIERLGLECLDALDIKRLLFNILTDDQITFFEEEKELDFSYTAVETGERFRVNIHQQKGEIEVAFHKIESKIRSLKNLGLDKDLKDLLDKPGLLIISGPASSGKSSLLASIIQDINIKKEVVIVTLEEPIEYVFSNKKSIIKQREIGTDADSCEEALKKVERMDPDVIMVSHVKNEKVAQELLNATNAKHLVLTGIEAFSATEALLALLKLIPEKKQTQYLKLLASKLIGIITINLLPGVKDNTHVLAYEKFIATNTAKRIISDGNLKMLNDLIVTAQEQGMQTMATSVKKLYEAKKISQHTAQMYNPEIGK